MKRSLRFGTDGWRGVIADDFTFANLRRVSQAAAEVFLEKGGSAPPKVSVGYDTRFLSPQFARVAAEVLAANGIQVRLSNSHLTTPALSWDVVNARQDWGIMLTASHNPPRFNGFKIKTREGASADDSITRLVEERANSPDLSITPLNAEPTIAEVDMVAPYLERVSSLVEWERIGMMVSHVISDPLYGAVQNRLLTLLEEHSSIPARGIHTTLNPVFGGLDPEPIPRNLKGLVEEVVRSASPTLGIAQDGDGDRLGMVDEEGNWVSPHQVLSLLLIYLAKEKGLRGQVVKSFSTTMLVEHICQDLGLECVETGIGFKYIAPHMISKPTLIAGEESGGVAFGFHIPERDGILAGLMVLEMLGTWGITLKDAVKRMERRYGPYLYKRIDLTMPVEKGRRIVDTLEASPPERLGNLKVVEVRRKDGVKLVLQGGAWLLVRASGTEPLLRLYAEAPRPKELERILDDGNKACRAALSR